MSIEELLSHASWLRGLAFHLVRDNDLAEDLVQETWLASLRRPPMVGQSPRGWLYRVLVNAWRTRHRTDSRREAREARVFDASEESSAENVVARAEVQHKLVSAVFELDEPYRTTVLLRYFDGFTSARIAREHGVPEGTVRSRLQKARDRLKRQMDEAHGGDRKAWVGAVLAMSARQTSFSSMALVAALVIFAVAGGLFFGGDTPAPLTNEPQIGERSPIAAALPDEVGIQREENVESDVAPARDPAALATIELRAIGVYGSPLKGVRVEVLGGGVTSEESGEDGAIRCSLDVSEPKIVTLQLTGNSLASGQHVVRALPGETVTLGDVVMKPGGSIEGRVVDENGDPALGAVVDLSWSLNDLESGESPVDFAKSVVHGPQLDAFVPDLRTTVGEGGEFRLDGVPLGRHVLWASTRAGASSASKPMFVRHGEVTRDALISLDSNRSADTLLVRVVDPDGVPVEGARLFTVGTPFPGQGQRETGLDGSVFLRKSHVQGMGGRSGAITVYHPTRPLGVVRHSIYDDGDVTIELPAARPIEFRIASTSGDPIEVAKFDMYTPSDSTIFFFDHEVVRDPATGLFRLPRPGPGIRVRIDGIAEHHEPTALIEDTLGQDLLGVREVVMQSLSGWTGVVISNGRPVPSAEFWVRRTRSGDDNGFGGSLTSRLRGMAARERTDAKGIYLATMIAAGDEDQRELMVRAPGLGVARVALPMPATRARIPIDVGLTPGGTIDVEAIGPTGAVAGVLVVIHDEQQILFERRTGPDGVARFEDIPPGQYRVGRGGAESQAQNFFRAMSQAPTILGEAQAVEVAAAQSLRLKLPVPATGGTALAGVIRINGIPLDHAMVSVSPRREGVAGAGNDLQQATDLATTVDGEFLLAAPAETPLTLVIRLADMDPVCRVLVSVAPGRGSRQLSFDYQVASVRGTIVPPPSSRTRFTLNWTGNDGESCAIPIRTDETGAFEFPRVLAGDIRVIRTDDSGEEVVWNDFVPASSTTTVDLR